MCVRGVLLISCVALGREQLSSLTHLKGNMVERVIKVGQEREKKGTELKKGTAVASVSIRRLTCGYSLASLALSLSPGSAS